MQREFRRRASIPGFFVLILAAAFPLSAQSNPKNLNPIPSPRGLNSTWGGGMEISFP